jgi:hypothetical protein
MEERMDAMGEVDFKVFSGIFSYSPTLSWLSEPFAIIGSLGDFDTGGRHKSVEEIAFSMPASSFIENSFKTGSGLIDNIINDKDVTLEQANRARTLLPANSHFLIQYATNVMFKEVGLERKE